MKALVIAPEPFFSPRGTPFSVYYRALVTAEQGVEIDLLTYGEGQDVAIPGVRLTRIPALNFLGPVKVGPSFTKFFLDILMVIWTVRLLLRNRYDFVHAHEEAVFFCRFLKPLFGFKLAYDMHSSLPQQLTNFNFTTSRSLIGVFGQLERSSLRHADAVITICPDLADYALANGAEPERHLLIENSIFDDVKLAEGERATAEEQSPVALQFPDGAPLVVYAGTLEQYQGLDILVDAFALVHEARPDARLLIVGGTSDQVLALESRAREAGLDGTCIFTGRVSKKQAMHYLGAASVLVSPRRLGTNTPLKVYEQLASGKPLVATNIWSHTQVLDDTVCILVDPEPVSMAQGILAALNDEAKRRQIVAAARKLYDTKYSRSAYEGKIRQFLRALG
jgi:glycosyltransferase involved in cell wall biosynthesis